MKRKLTACLLVCVAVIMLCACGRHFTCGFCGEEKTGRSHEVDFWGGQYDICHDCYTALEELGQGMFGN